MIRKYTGGAGGGIRTHEAYAVDLKSTPFDRSGTPAIHFIYYIVGLFLSELYHIYDIRSIWQSSMDAMDAMYGLGWELMYGLEKFYCMV